MIDIHSHILPRVDDGSEDMEMSIDMARIYVNSGFRTVIATPHYIQGSSFTTMENNRETLEEFKEELNKMKIDLDIFLGNEVYMSMDLIRDIEERKLATLNGTKYILIELPMHDIPLYVENTIYELLIKGYIPIIAHPERNGKIIENPNILYEYINKGALAQLNLPSLEGRYGPKVEETGRILLKNNMIHFVATDAHTNRSRSPRVKRGLEVLSTLVSEEDCKKLTYKNAELLLKDEMINIKSPVEYIKKKNFFSLFKR